MSPHQSIERTEHTGVVHQQLAGAELPLHAGLVGRRRLLVLRGIFFSPMFSVSFAAEREAISP